MARIVKDTLCSPVDVSIPCKIATGKPFDFSWRIGSSWGSQDTWFAVEIILFTYFHWQKEIFDITKHIETSNTRYVGLIGTGSKLEIVEFVYLVFASFTMVFVMTRARCNTLLVYINSISYTRYLSLVDHTKRNFAINESAQKLLESNSRLPFQTISPKYSVRFPLPQRGLALVTTIHVPQPHPTPPFF